MCERNLFSRRTGLLLLVLAVAIVGCPPGFAQAQGRATLTFQDLMKVRQVRSPTLSDDGRWVALTAVPDRGDGEVLVNEVDGGRDYVIPLGSDPEFSADGAWLAARLNPTFEARETATEGESLQSGMVLLDTRTGAMERWDGVRRFGFSGDGRWLGRLRYPPEAGPDDTGPEGEEAGRTDPPAPAEQGASRTREDPGTTLILRDLASGLEVELSNVRDFYFDHSGAWMAYAVATSDGEGDGIFARRLEPASAPVTLQAGTLMRVGAVEWWSEGTRLAWVLAEEDSAGAPGPGRLSVWDGERVLQVAGGGDLADGWTLPVVNELAWSRDGGRLFYGTRPLNQEETERFSQSVDPNLGSTGEGGAEPEASFDPFDIDAILEGRAVDVWHTDDPLINPNQKRVWAREQARTYRAVYHVESETNVQLGDTTVQIQDTPQNPQWALGTSARPYLKEQTWTGGAEDVYLVNMDSGVRTLVSEGFSSESSAANSWIGLGGRALAQSPGGRFVVWFQKDHWHLFDAQTGNTRNLTQDQEVPFFDVDHDYPNPRGGHGIGGWVGRDDAVLIHDKYDVWQFPTQGGPPVNLTAGQGRARGLVLRVLQIDPEKEYFRPGEAVPLASFDERDKGFGYYRTYAGRGGLEQLLDEDERVQLVSKAPNADRVLFTREDYDEFPDLWVADSGFGNPRKVSDVNPGLIDRFAWGTSELVEWISDDGIPLQGVVIKPGNYDPEKRYPVLTYFYRFFSQRLHEFNEPVINHRPSFPIYASDGYVVFLPDVRFEVGRPGLSALKSVVPGVKKLVDMGLADPEALGLHGHSWSGYTTAFIVTQTNLFAAAVAGAPVANMTSAYGGIRWGTGLARQFQYEMGQSRLSGSLFEAREEYIENSPLFYADRVETPLVLMHGDEDDAVPWYQSIELYLALRRAGKTAVFLQYRGEPHHPRLYGNKLDYSIKMKAFFDHLLKGEPAPSWWAEGVPYSGR